MILLKSNDNNLLYSDEDLVRVKEESSEKNRESFRDNFERDFARIIHSSSFRRLQGKTQVFGPEEGDYHRTRLTHTLEVAQIARGITIELNYNNLSVLNNVGKVDTSLIEAAALAHDLGHPPYGHQGERALNKHMNKFGLGFEGNAHTFRLITKLENDNENGLNLTRATLLSILKYPVTYDKVVNPNNQNKPPKFSVFTEDEERLKWLIDIFDNNEIDFFQEIKEGDTINDHRKTNNKTLECSIIEIADDIAYVTHDLQDALKLELIDLQMIADVLEQYKNTRIFGKLCQKFKDVMKNSNTYKKDLKNFFADMIHLLIKDVFVEERREFKSPRLKYLAKLSNEGERLIKKLNEVTKSEVIMSQRVQTLEWKGGYIISKLFDAFMNEPKLLLLPAEYRALNTSSDKIRARVVCDYIAGMTDKYAQRMYSRLFDPKQGKLLDL